MGIRIKYFSHQSGANSKQVATMITTENRACEFFIQKAKLKNLNPIKCMGSLGLNSSKSIQFFNGDHKHVKFLRLLHAITMISYDVKISLTPSDFSFGIIKVDSS
jgi:hypothetical protein